MFFYEGIREVLNYRVKIIYSSYYLELKLLLFIF